MGGIIHAGTNTVMNWTFHATCKSLGLKSGVMHLTCPSIIRVYDSDRSNDAVTLFFSLEYGRCRTVARSLHEHKL